LRWERWLVVSIALITLSFAVSALVARGVTRWLSVMWQISRDSCRPYCNFSRSACVDSNGQPVDALAVQIDPLDNGVYHGYAEITCLDKGNFTVFTE
jgi:hypothetical protein